MAAIPPLPSTTAAPGDTTTRRKSLTTPLATVKEAASSDTTTGGVRRMSLGSTPAAAPTTTIAPTDTTSRRKSSITTPPMVVKDGTVIGMATTPDTTVRRKSLSTPGDVATTTTGTSDTATRRKASVTVPAKMKKTVSFGPLILAGAGGANNPVANKEMVVATAKSGAAPLAVVGGAGRGGRRDSKAVALAAIAGTETQQHQSFKSTDFMEAYQLFATVDLDTSGQLRSRNLIRLLIDADVMIEGGNDPVSFPVEFPEADCGIVYEEIKEYGETSVLIKSIEEQSPASKSTEVMMGLRVLSINNCRVDCLRDVTRALRHVPDGMPIVIRFQEPAFVVTKYNNALDLSIKAPNKPRSRENSRNSSSHGHTSKASGKIASIAHSQDKAPRKKLTVELEIGAFNNTEDFAHMVQRCIQATLEEAGLGFGGQIMVEVEPVRHDFVLYADKMRFSLLFKTGGACQRTSHTLLGFQHEDTKEHKIHKGKRRRIEGIDLTYLAQTDLEELAEKIMARYDTSKDSVMVFEEFVSFYKEFIETPAKVKDFKLWIREQFLSEEELKERAEQAKENEARERRRLQMEELRSKNRGIRAEQMRIIKAQRVKEHDGQYRRRRTTVVSLPAVAATLQSLATSVTSSVATSRTEGSTLDKDDVEEGSSIKTHTTPGGTLKEDGSSILRIKRIKEREIKQKQRYRVKGVWTHLKAQHRTQIDEKIKWLNEQDDNIIRMAKKYGSDLVTKEKPKFTHPCFFGYTTFRRLPFDVTTMNPIFMGQHSCQMAHSRTSKYSGIREVMRDISKGIKQYKYDVWKHYPAPRTSTNAIRSRVRSNIPEMYDDQLIIHPACFGQMLCVDTKDPALIHPSMIGFTLEKKPPMDIHSHALLTKLVQDGTMATSCEVCTVGRPGCPNCWSFPSGFLAQDFEYNGSPLSDRYPPIHTRLTTERSIFWYRKQQRNYITVYIKSLPYGEVTVLRVDRDDTVAYLYQLHRCNSKHGTEPSALYIPHIMGAFSVDNTFIPASDLCNEVDTGQEPLAHYNLGKAPGSRVVMLHLTIEHMEHVLGNIAQFIKMTMTIQLPPDWRIRYEFDYLPDNYSDDPIQQSLANIIDMQIENARKVKERPSLMEPTQSGKNLKGTIMLMTKQSSQAMQQKREERRHEMEKMLKLNEIIITDGNTEGEQQLKRRTSLGTALELLRRQRYRGFTTKDHKQKEKEGEEVENPFITLAAVTSFGSNPEDDFIIEEGEGDELAAYKEMGV